MPNNLIGNVFVLQDPAAAIATSQICKSIIGFRNVIPTSTVSGASADASYPFDNCLDYRDNTQYSPNASSGTVTIEFRQSTDVTLDYIGIAIHNGKSAGMSGTLQLLINGVWTNVATFTPLGDNKTICEYFEPQNSQRQRLIINYTSKLYIGSIYLGKSWTFERLPNTGFTPANSNNIDEVVGFKNNRGQFVMGRRKEVGFAQSGDFDFIDFGDIESEYIDYMNHVKDSKAFFMKWNVELDQNVFGQHANPNGLTAPTYATPNTSSFRFSMVGYN